MELDLRDSDCNLHLFSVHYILNFQNCWTPTWPWSILWKSICFCFSMLLKIVWISYKGLGEHILGYGYPTLIGLHTNISAWLFSNTSFRWWWKLFDLKLLTQIMLLYTTQATQTSSAKNGSAELHRLPVW